MLVSGRAFQSTHPARGATSSYLAYLTLRSISIHAPREGCDAEVVDLTIQYILKISIHAPREGCDPAHRGICPVKVIFQSTHPARGATGTRRDDDVLRLFQSTHPARGATGEVRNPFGPHLDFNPRTPRGVRQAGSVHLLPQLLHFNPRTPRGVRPVDSARCRTATHFNPRTPRGVRRVVCFKTEEGGQYFNPRTPRGVRPGVLLPCAHCGGISIHAPREGCDVVQPSLRPPDRISIHAPREGCDVHDGEGGQ